MADSGDEFNFAVPTCIADVSDVNECTAPALPGHVVSDEDADGAPHPTVVDALIPNLLPPGISVVAPAPGPASLSIAEIIQMMSFDPSASHNAELPLLVVDWSMISRGRYRF